MIRKLLVAEPGADFSIQDVYSGLVGGLRQCEIEVDSFPLTARLNRAASWLNYCYRKARKLNPDIVAPTNADLVYQAGKELVLQALRGDQDGVLIITGMFLHPDLLIMLRRAGIPTAMVLTESPYQDVSQARVIPYVDLCWTNDRSSVATLRAANPNVGYLPAGYNPAVHTDRQDDDYPDVPSHDLLFVGTSFPDRLQFLSQVDWSGIDFGLYGAWDLRPRKWKLEQHFRGGPIPNAQTAALYRAAKIGLNLYRRTEHSNPDAPLVPSELLTALNPRAYELAATGCFQLSSYRSEVAAVFGDSVPTFETPQELEGLVRHFLAHPEERAAHAAEARRRISAHTWAARASIVLRDLATVWGQRIPQSATG